MGLSWLLVFVFAQKAVRIAAFGLALLVCLLYQHAEFTAPTEAGAVMTLRHAAVFLRDYKQIHPAEGYPSTIPPLVPNCRARGLYEFRYTAEKSSASVTADRFTLVAVPIPQQIPRSLRSFTLPSPMQIGSDCGCRSPAGEYFRSQNIGALRARVANLAKRHGLTKTRRQKLAEEGISFLCSCDSSKPVAFARSHFWWNRF
jgi:hypothetical protein